MIRRMSLALVVTTLCSTAGLGQSTGNRPSVLRVDAHTSGANRLAVHTIYDSSYQRPRRIWIYTPTDYDSKAAPYPLLVAFDGVEYRDTIPLPLILDSLYATGRSPAFVAILIDNSGGAVRIADLGNASRMSRFLSRQLLPWVRRRLHVTTDPSRVIVTGSSAGGLGAAFVALQDPELFGNVVSQSGAFWRGAEGSNHAPYEWLTKQVMARPRQKVKFWLDVGDLENQSTLGGAGPNFKDANRRFRDALVAKGYEVTYTEVPHGQHTPSTWMNRLPVAIADLTSSWK